MENTKGEVAENIRREFGLQDLDTPRIISRQIVPTLEVAEKYSRIVKTASSSTTGSTLYTTPTDKDFYLTYLHLSKTQDAANDATSYTITATFNGATTIVARILAQTLTAGSDHIEITFPYPLRVDRNTNITTTATAVGAGTHTVHGTIAGFLK